MADPLQFSDIYGTNGVGFYVSDIGSGSATNRKRAVNDAYVDVAIKAWWRKRSFDYTSASSPALTDGTRTYATPTTTGSVFDQPYRLGYRRSGAYIDVPILGDEEWLQRSLTASTDKGDPQYARLIRSSSTVQIELNRPISQNFINQIATLTLEYWIQIVRMSDDTDEPIVPANLRHHLVILGAERYAIGQGDRQLLTFLREPRGSGKVSLVAQAYESILKQDLTRTGRPRQLKPKLGYEPQMATSESLATDYED